MHKKNLEIRHLNGNNNKQQWKWEMENSVTNQLTREREKKTAKHLWQQQAPVRHSFRLAINLAGHSFRHSFMHSSIHALTTTALTHSYGCIHPHLPNYPDAHFCCSHCPFGCACFLFLILLLCSLLSAIKLALCHPPTYASSSIELQYMLRFLCPHPN